jgi:hypothetical protein
MPKFIKDDGKFFWVIYHFFADADRRTWAAIGFGLFVAFLYFRIFFRDVSGFEEDVDKSGKIPIVDKDYDYVESKWSGNKIWIWILLSVGSGIAAYYQLPELFPRLLKTP